MVSAQPTLREYYFPLREFSCALKVKGEKFEPHLLDRKINLRGPFMKMGRDFVDELGQWTRVYSLDDIKICYDRPEGRLVHPPKKVVVLSKDRTSIPYFFKEFMSTPKPPSKGGDLDP